MTCNSFVGTQPATVLGRVTVANQAEYPAAKCNQRQPWERRYILVGPSHWQLGTKLKRDWERSSWALSLPLIATVYELTGACFQRKCSEPMNTFKAATALVRSPWTRMAFHYKCPGPHIRPLVRLPLLETDLESRSSSLWGLLEKEVKEAHARMALCCSHSKAH